MGTGGEGGIRTLGTLAGTTVFETAPIDRSGTSPRCTTTTTPPGPSYRQAGGGDADGGTSSAFVQVLQH